jgi:hypothetical protein
LSLCFKVRGALVEENGVSNDMGMLGTLCIQNYICRPYCTSVESGPRESIQ